MTQLSVRVFNVDKWDSVTIPPTDKNPIKIELITIPGKTALDDINGNVAPNMNNTRSGLYNIDKKVAVNCISVPLTKEIPIAIKTLTIPAVKTAIQYIVRSDEEEKAGKKRKRI